MGISQIPQALVPAYLSGRNWTLVNTGGTALTGAGTITVSGLNGAENIFVLVQNADNNVAGGVLTFRINSDSGTNYRYAGKLLTFPSAYSATGLSISSYNLTTSMYCGKLSSSTGDTGLSGYINIQGGSTTGLKSAELDFGGIFAGSSGAEIFSGGCIYSGSSTITSVSLLISGGNFTGGTIYVYTSA